MTNYFPPGNHQPASKRKLSPAFIARIGKGRPAGSITPAARELKEYARQHTKEAIDVVVRIMKNAKNEPTVRLHAANIILDRGYGKPPQQIQGDPEQPLTVNGDGLSDTEAARRIAYLLTRAVTVEHEPLVPQEAAD